MDDIVPLTVERVPLHWDGLHLRVADAHCGGVPSPNGGRPVEFEGFDNENGTLTYAEVKGYGNATWLKEATFGEGGIVEVPDGSKALDKLNEMLNQMRRQLYAIGSGARLRFVAAEPAVIQKMTAFAKANLRPDQFNRVKWEQQDGDSKFRGC
jgi:hypothetical protein